MTPDEIRQAIATGGPDLQAHWGRVFEPPDPNEAPPENTPEDPWKVREWERARQVKQDRAGLLHPDAAYDIAQILGVSPDLVAAVKALR